MLLNTICLLVKMDASSDHPAEVLLARKKTGFGAGKIVGVGGTVEPHETPRSSSSSARLPEIMGLPRSA